MKTFKDYLSEAKYTAPHVKIADLSFLSVNFNSISFDQKRFIAELKQKTINTIEESDKVQNVKIKSFDFEYVQPMNNSSVLIFFRKFSYTFDVDGTTQNSELFKNKKMAIFT